MADLSQVKIGSTTYNLKDANASTTDTKVNQSSSTTANWRKVILSYQDSSSVDAAVATNTNVVYGAQNIEAQPSTGTLKAIKYNVANKVILNYNATTESLDFNFL